MINQTYSRISSILDSESPTSDKVGKLCSIFMVQDLSKIDLPEPASEYEMATKRRFTMFMTDLAIDTVCKNFTPGILNERIDHAYTVISAYVHDPRLITPLVILWAAGRMSRMGMEPGLCFTQILDIIYKEETERKYCFDLKYTFRDKDVLRALEAVKDATLIDPIVKRDFLLGMKQILTYLKGRDRDFKKGLALTLVEKLL